MAKSNSKRKTRSDKFPLTLHPTGQYCKKIRGKLYYFGSDKRTALERYLEQAAFLHAGKRPRPNYANANVSLKTLCNLYLDHQESRVVIGEIKWRQIYDQTSHLRDFARFLDPNRVISEISTIDLQNYRKKLIKAGKAPNTINNRVSAIKAIYNWATDNEIIDNAPNLKAIKKISSPKIKRTIFTSEQVSKLLKHANHKMKAMILLGLNCGFGCTDCSELRWEHLDLRRGRVNLARSKTGVDRNLVLWDETVKAIKALPRMNDRVFNTNEGNAYVRIVRKEYSDGTSKLLSHDSVGKEFSKLLKRAGIKTEKGVGFYTLRRTAATLAARSGDPFAVQKLLGHADLKMATTYVQDVSEQTDRVINNIRKLIIQDGS